MADPERYQSALTGPEVDQALLDMANHTSERYAKGTVNGAPVTSGSVGYQDNSKYYKDQAAAQVTLAQTAATQANAAAARAEGAIPAGTAGAVFFDRDQNLTEAQKQKARQNIRAGGSNPNLLDNPWFTVNQRGVTSGTPSTAAYVGPDRWKFFQANWNISDGVVSLSWGGGGTAAGILQYTGPQGYKLVRREVTVSAYVNGTLYTKTVTIPDIGYGTSDITLGGGVLLRINTDTLTNNRGVEFQFRTTSTTPITIGPIKVERGSTSTLANDGPPDDDLELMKCQRYFQRIKTRVNLPLGFGFALSSTDFYFTIPTPVLLREGATWTVASSGVFAALGAGQSTHTLSSIALASGTNQTGRVSLQAVTSGLTTRQTYMVLDNGSSGYIDISADL